MTNKFILTDMASYKPGFLGQCLKGSKQLWRAAAVFHNRLFLRRCFPLVFLYAIFHRMPRKQLFMLWNIAEQFLKFLKHKLFQLAFVDKATGALAALQILNVLSSCW